MRFRLLLFALTLSPGPLVAQTHHVAAPEKVTRAVAVFEYTGDLAKPTASRLVPVSLFINGRLEDAGLYMARPVPFALAPGNLYFIEKAGDERGTLSIEHARDFTTGRLLADQDPAGAWYGFGPFQPLSPPKPPAPLHDSGHPPAITVSHTNGDSDRPHLTTKSDTSASTPSAPANDPSDRPTLSRHDASRSGSTDSGDAQTGTGGQSTGSKPSDNDPERPSLRIRNPENTGKKSPPQAGVTGPEHSLNDDPDRPRIRHGITVAEQDAQELKTVPADMHQVAAISDAANREPHVFTRDWDSAAEHTDVLAHMQMLARAHVTTYLAQNHLTPGTAPAAKPTVAPSTAAAAPADTNAPTLRRTPNGIHTATASPTGTSGAPESKPSATKAGSSASTHSAHGRTAAISRRPAPSAPLLLTDEHLSGFLLTYGGLPTFVYTAQVPTTTGAAVYVTLVAERLPSGEIQTSLVSVTDATHLDRTPWLRPIDAVDPDASHRGSLLFELRAQSSRQFALYRLVTAQADQQFVTSPIE